MSLDYFKSQFAKFEHIHFNNAGLQPITQAARDKIIYWAQRFYQEGYATDADYQADVFNTRVQLSHLIGCTAQEIAFFTSTASAVNQVAFSIGLKPGDEVVMWDQEFSSHLYPWREACEQFGATLVTVESEKNLATPTEKYKSKISAKTKVLAFSWVQFMNGAMMSELPELIRYAKEREIFVFIDIIQGLGYLEFDLWKYGVDAVMGGSHKWLCSPVGVGYLAIRKDLALKVKPRNVGATTYGTCDDPSSLVCEPKRDASRFEPGSKQVLEITAMGASLEVIQKAGLATIRNESLRLAQLLREQLEQNGYQVVLPMLDKNNSKSALSVPFINFQSTENKTLAEISKKLSEHKILHVQRGPGIRFSIQAFNTENEISQVISVLR